MKELINEQRNGRTKQKTNNFRLELLSEEIKKNCVVGNRNEADQENRL